uniref:LRRNT domain-containing protein n=1 Tax=Anolis carolinensis TaxID=28377 RepID=H9GAI4_ANOCA
MMIADVSCPKECSCQYLAVNCTGKQLEEFPATIPLDTRQLVLAQNKLSYLPSMELNFLSDLIYLDCSSNILGEDLDFMFVSIIKLVYLDLSFNNLTQITFGTFSQLTSLVVLKLSDNPSLVEIEKDSFANNSWLRHLDVSRCSLAFIDTSTVKDLPNLRSLGLSGNPWFCNCSFMELHVNPPTTKNISLLTNHTVHPTYQPAYLNILTSSLYSHGSFISTKRLTHLTNKLHYKCYIHFDDQDYLFLGLVGFCIFSAATVLAWLLGLCAVIYDFLTATGEEDEDEDEE